MNMLCTCKNTYTTTQINNYKKIAIDAQHTIKEIKDKVNNPTIILDIDETILQNRCWRCGNDLREVKKISPIFNLYQWCIKSGIKVFFVTARQTDGESITINQLKNIGIKKYNGLFLRNKNYKPTQNDISIQKFNIRKQIYKSGNSILANIGDQPHDLVGGYSLYAYLLPSY